MIVLYEVNASKILIQQVTSNLLNQAFQIRTEKERHKALDIQIHLLAESRVRARARRWIKRPLSLMSFERSWEVGEVYCSYPFHLSPIPTKLLAS